MKLKMWETIKNFLIENSSSIIISLLIGAFFFVLGPLGLWFSNKRVKKQSIITAKAELLDVIESMIVNREEITKSKLTTIFKAIDRQYGNNLGFETDLENILEDLTLRFIKSKHLSSDQKNVYIEQIDKLINSINKDYSKSNNSLALQERNIPKSVRTLLNEIKIESKNNDYEELTKTINQLYKKIENPTNLIDYFEIIYRNIINPTKFTKNIAKLYVLLIILYLVAKFLSENVLLA